MLYGYNNNGDQLNRYGTKWDTGTGIHANGDKDLIEIDHVKWNKNEDGINGVDAFWGTRQVPLPSTFHFFTFTFYI